MLDECVDQRLRKELIGHEIRTVQEMGWAGTKNGQLLQLAQQAFDVFLTVDRNLYFQQNLPKFNIVVMVIVAKTNRLADLKPLVPKILEELVRIKPGEVITVGQN